MVDEITTTGIKLIDSYIDKKNPKFELNGAYLDKDNKRIVATDTKAIIAYKFDVGIDAILHKNSFEMICKTAVKNKPKGVHFYERDGEAYHFGSSRVIEMQSFIKDTTDKKEGCIIGMPEINGKYPDWKRLMVDRKSLNDTHDFNFDSEEILYHDKDKKNPKTKMKSVLCKAGFIEFEIAKLGAIVDSKYVKPIEDYLVFSRDKDIEILFTFNNFPVRIEHQDFSLVIMPIVP